MDRFRPTAAVIFGGTGDTGRRLARHLATRSPEIELFATTRRDPGEVEEGGGDATVLRWGGARDPDGLEAVLEAVAARGHASIVAYNVVGAWLRDPEEGIYGTVETLVAGLARGLGRTIASARLVHCSATSIYGDRPGEVLDATSPPSPVLRVGRIHARAEELLLDAADERLEALVCRVPHIYGPGRERTFELMCRGVLPVAGDGNNPMHHIHVEDLAAALCAAAHAPLPELPVLDIVDDVAEPFGAYCDFIAEACGHEPPPRCSLERARRTGVFAELLGPHFEDERVLTEFFRYMTSSATIDNTKTRRVLELELRYPQFRLGLREMLEARARSESA